MREVKSHVDRASKVDVVKGACVEFSFELSFFQVKRVGVGAWKKRFLCVCVKRCEQNEKRKRENFY